jgi:hypothetical protein
VKQTHGLFTVALTAMNHAEVGDDLCFVLFVAELAKDEKRLLEVRDRLGLGAAVCEREREVVECQRFSLLVSEIARDREGHAVLLGRLLVVASTAKVRAELVEPTRVTGLAGRARRGMKSMR